MIQVTFICHTCQGVKKHNADDNPVEYLFTTYSDSWNHMFKNPDHYMDVMIEEVPDDKDC